MKGQVDAEMPASVEVSTVREDDVRVEAAQAEVPAAQAETSQPPAAQSGVARPGLCIALLVALGFILGCAEFSVIGIEAELSRDFGVSLSRVGDFISFFALAYAVCTPVLALTTGRFRRHTLLVAYCLVFCAANLLAMLAGSFATMLFARIVLGSVSGALLAVGVTYIPELVEMKRVPGMISIVYAAFSMAMVLSTSAGKLIVSVTDWHVLFYAVFALGIVTCALLFKFLPRTGATDEPATVGDQLCLLRDPRILAGISIFVFGVGAVYTFYGYITPYLQDVLGFDAVGASGILMAYGCVCLVSNLASGWLASRFGMKALRVTFPVQAVLLLALFLLGSRRVPAVAAIMCVAFAMYLTSTPCIAMFLDVATREYPKALTMASSLEPMAFNVGIAFGTVVGGIVVAGPGLAYVGIVGSAFSLVALVLVLFTMRLVKRGKERARAGAGE